MKRFLILICFATVVSVTVGCGTIRNKNNATMAHVQQLSKAEFLQHIADFEGSSSEWKYLGTKPAIVDFYADWCGPCRALAPALEEVAAEYKGRINVYKVNVDREQELAAAFDVRSIPTLMFIPQQGAPEIFRGTMTAEQLRRHVESVLLHPTAAK
ncbi:MAG: thioredoxin [Rikenellaceae bacterium]|nr:thioredoxin [Rikenellaceae bacterium]